MLRHGKLLPVVKLADIFNGSLVSNSLLNSRTQSYLSERKEIEGIMVAAKAGNKPVAIYVDDVIGVQKVVLKELGRLEVNSQFYSAAAVMGDGTVAMVLDIDRLIGLISSEKVEV